LLLLRLLQLTWKRRKLKPLFRPYPPSPLLLRRHLEARHHRQHLPRPLAAWSCPKPARALFTKHPSCRRLNQAQATLLRALEFSVASQSSIVVPRAVRGVIRSGPPAALRPQDNSLADRAPSIRLALPWAALPALAPPAHGPASVPVLASADHLVPASVPVLARAALRQPAKHLARSAPLLVDAVDARNTPRPRKAQ
jgi:hypothetical protein